MIKDREIMINRDIMKKPAIIKVGKMRIEALPMPNRGYGELWSVYPVNNPRDKSQVLGYQRDAIYIAAKRDKNNLFW